MIIDGIDEGRSKVNEQAFNAFLEDLIKLSAGSSKASFVLLGRTQALLDCWVYLLEKGLSVGLASIDPFSKEHAVRYINTFADPPVSGQRDHYDAARDSILSERLGPRLSACFVEMPCEVTLSGSDELELTAPIEISARKINLLAPGLIVRAQPKSSEKEVILQAREIASSLTSLPVESGVEFTVGVTENSNLHYPLVKYVKKVEMLPASSGVKEKHLKLRKILTHFRSHSRGALAKLRAKVENERVAGNDVGRPVLERLIRDGVLIPDGKFYFLEPAKVDQFLGVSWMRLREGVINHKLVEYLQSIK